MHSGVAKGREDPRRCEQHGLVVAADGRCVLCRRRQGRSKGRVAWVVMLLLFVGGAGAIYALMPQDSARRAVDRMPSGAGASSTPGAAPITGKPDRPTREPDLGTSVDLEATVVRYREKQQIEERAYKERRARAEREALAARKRMDRQYDRLAAGAKEPIAIRMYAADW
jgi:hypothetical protein